MAYNSEQSENEISLNEMFQSLWTYKIFIICITGISIFLSAMHGANQDKEYTATALFKLDTGQKNNRINLPSGLGNLASLAGVATGGPLLGGLMESYFAREFITELNKNLNLRDDKYFNSYNPNAINPEWKSRLKEFLGFPIQDTKDVNEIVWRSIIKNYRKNVTIGLTEGFNIEIKVVHSDPGRAADIANGIMDLIIDNSNKKAEDKRSKQLDYMSKILADALYELENSQKKLKEFTIDNTTLPLEGFAAATINLENKKESTETTKLLLLAVNEILILYEKNDINAQSYIILKRSHPIVDDVRFRRIFGQNEIISEWSWPKESIILDMQKTLSDRLTRLKIELNNAQIEAERLAKNAEKYAEITREVTIAEATYTVMFEQVKANSVLAGFTDDEDEIFEYAVKPTSPSAPKNVTILVIGISIGLLFSILLTLIFSASRGVFYSKRSLLSSNNAIFHSRTKPFKFSPKLKLSKLNAISNLPTITAVRNLILAIRYSHKEIILISNIGSKLKASTISKLLGINLQDDKIKVAYIDFSKKVVSNDEKSDNEVYQDFIVHDKFENFEIINPNGETLTINFLARNESKEKVMKLKTKYHYIIMSAERNDTVSLTRFMDPKDVFHIALTRRNKTKRKLLEKISKVLPLGAQLYD